MNAMAVPIRFARPADFSAHVIDLFGGAEDIAARRIRMTSESVFSEDPLRVMRAIRQEAQLDFAIDAATVRAAARAAPRLTQVAAERIREELTRILESPNAARAIRRADSFGVLERVIPDLAHTRHVTQNPDRHSFCVLEHCIQTMQEFEEMINGTSPFTPFEVDPNFFDQPVGTMSRGAVMKMAALLHDVGKPAARTEKTAVYAS